MQDKQYRAFLDLPRNSLKSLSLSLLLSTGLAVLPVVVAAQESSATDVGAQTLIPPGAPTDTDAIVSGDGSVAVIYARQNGSYIYKNGQYSAVTVPRGYDDALVYDVNQDGSAWLGALVSVDSDGYPSREYVVWNDNVATFLPEGLRPEAISDDGGIVAGIDTGAGNFEGILWSQSEGTIAKFTSPKNIFGVEDLSGNGKTVVGSHSTDGSNLKFSYEAYRWSEEGGFQSLGTSPGFEDSRAKAVNRDGNVVVGYEWDQEMGSIRVASRWSEPKGMVSLGTLDGHTRSMAFDVNADGSVVVGSSSNKESGQGFRWTEPTGMISIDQWLSDAGVELLDEFTYPTTMTQAYSVSDDGEVVAGYTISKSGDEVAVLARVSDIGSGIINQETFNASVRETGANAIRAGAGIAEMTLFGAHHRTLLDSGLAHKTDKNTCLWVATDYGRDDETDTDMNIAEVGVCRDIGNTRVGIGVGQSRAEQDWSLGGGADYDGQYVLVEAVHQFANGFQPSIFAMAGDYDTELKRNYQNGGAIDRSEGSPDADTKAVRLRADWKELVTLGQAVISPYGAYTWMHSHLDGYTEEGGGFPTRYDSSDLYTSDLRLGAATHYAFNDQTSLRFALEGVRRLDEDTGSTSGQILGLGSFDVSGVDIEQTWARALLDVDYQFNRDLLFTVGANTASSGDQTSWGLTAGLRTQF
ncbi:autotransporter domain-containing protein [Salinivibrio sp. HTSP]|uniref:autotransporter domain-containing protein n=1 Tax=Salinivibrio sp. HTSP TaxID=2115977 RepID=UPI000E3122BC|nr:autotransporter domain-containing protein [Salinivibrio sp. HTSP]